MSRVAGEDGNIYSDDILGDELSTSSDSGDEVQSTSQRSSYATRFRLLIIGKSGCGKTTILSKVCGEEVADKPSTTRGFHNIERQMEFKDNKLFIVHDSEGFEAGQDDELRVVTNFIKSRSKEKDVNKRLHAIWYCLTTNARPIQQAEELFFSTKHDVPIIAIFTKFDLFVEDQLQRLMESVDEDELDEEMEAELEKNARQVAMEKFEQHFKGELLKKQYAPEAVVALEDIPGATLANARLGGLIAATMSVLELRTGRRSRPQQKDARRLAILFAAAQKADLRQKYRASLMRGLPGLLAIGKERGQSDYERPKLTRIWQNTDWGFTKAQLLSAFEKHVEDHPRTFGNIDCPKYCQDQKITSSQLEVFRCLQLVSDLTVIMTELFLLEVKDEATMHEIVGKYTGTPVFTYIQERLLETNMGTRYIDVKWAPGGFYNTGTFRTRQENTIEKVVRTYLLGIDEK